MNMQYFDLVHSPLKGINLIEASAGTGKTYIIAGLFLRLIVEKGIMADKILTVTYTEAATEELRSRIRERLKEALKALTDGVIRSENDDLMAEIIKKYKNSESVLWRLKDALTRFDETSICTIHGFCKRMLAENAFESNSLFEAELVKDQSALIQEIVDDFWRKNFYTASPLLIQYAIKNKINTSLFFEVLHNLSIDPSFEIIPKVMKPDFSKIETRFLIAYKELQNEWIGNKSIVENIFLSHKGLNKNKYGTHSPKLIFQMNEYLSSDNAVMMFADFYKFTVSSIRNSINKGFEAPDNKFFNICEDFLNIYNTLVSIFDKYIIFLKKEIFSFVKSEADKRKQKLNLITFDDLLIHMYSASAEGKDSIFAKSVRARYTVALIDEFQDSDPVQYNIFRNIFAAGDSVLFLIGDPKQSIYKFRGADIFAYLKASNNTNNRYTLGKNWRSTPELLKAVNTIFGNISSPFVFEEIEYNAIKSGTMVEKKDKDSLLKIWILNKDKSNRKDGVITKGKAAMLISQAVAGEIYNLISAEGGEKNSEKIAIKPGQIAVLVRKNHQARMVQNELRRFNIPGVLYGSASIFESHEAMEVERVMLSLSVPGDERLMKAALSTDMMGLNGKDILLLAQNEISLENYINRFYIYHDLWANYGFFRMFRHLIENEGVRGRLLSFIDGERRMTNLMHLAELMHNAESENMLSIETLIKWLREKHNSPDESDEYEIRLETDDDAVKILTIHRSKGLEFPVVFCPFTWEGSTLDKGKACIFHDPKNNYNLTLDLAQEDNNKNIAEIEELAENMRLLYVALTRAKQRAYLFWGRINETETSAPAYMFHYKEKDTHDPVKKLKDNKQFLTYDSIIKDIKDIAEESDGTIFLSDLPDFEYKRNIIFNTSGDFSRKIFNGIIKNEWKVSSFSSLTHDAKEYDERPDHDNVGNLTDISPESIINNKNIFLFPKGPVPGTCIHEVFEKLDYIRSEEEQTKFIIKEMLIKYGIGTDWQDTIFIMINNVLNSRLSPDLPNFILGNISENNRINELEFYFPLTLIASEGLAEIFRLSCLNLNKNFVQSVERLGFKPHKGFIKGYIDMVFQHNEKYYIVDWKSNFLGNDIEDYSIGKINSTMEEHYYILQYYIYSVALHKYLLSRKPGYNFDTHFGGVFYIFVRGAHPDYPYSGIYHDVPSKEMIQALSDYLSKPEVSAS
ncbi:MAG: exodeoxyribonuclease V subunit beta [Spirochaetes bacterium]|nr:exodeoxyribonuclease V subunit beta [Spirochaetota bacterium]